MRTLYLAFWFTATVAAAAGKPADHAALADDTDGRNWAAYGRTSGETHFSPLAEINRDTVSRLNLAWTLDLDVTDATTTPLAIDGVLYVAAGYSIVHAIDAKTGKLLWRYDPEVAKVAGRKLRNGWGIRGLAYGKGRLFVGTHDGRLIALDVKKGTPVWSVPTLDPNDASFISGPPRVFGDKVIIGFGGGDAGVVRGYVTAYDTNTGKQLWRWWTVPGDPAKGLENRAMEAAARTWTGEWWKSGGGGAVWNAMAYDPEFHRVYVGTGNTAAPVGGEQLYTCSVVALEADSGEYAWHYRTPPADAQDCDSSTDITLATLTIDGAARQVILHAPKNGLFTVIDRADGKAVSSAKLGGVRTLYPQSFSPRTGLAYVPAGMPASAAAAAPVDEGHSFLIAWDPVKQRANWQQPTPGLFNGGTVVTAGDLVFQGQADGYVMGYDAGSGRRLWQFYAATAALGTPITYLAGGKQHLTILAGPMSGAAAGAGPAAARFGWDPRIHPRRVLTFVLDGKAKLPPTPPPTVATPLDGTGMDVDPALADEGARMWSGCGRCHGPGAIGGGAAPDLRASQIPLNAATFASAVRTGNEPRGMPKFDELTDRELEALRHYVRARARLVTRPNGVAPPPPAAPAPAKEQKTDDEPERPPGSLESTTPRQ